METNHYVRNAMEDHNLNATTMEDSSFVRTSLELNLFFLRIMKEHLIFIESDLSEKDRDLAQKINPMRQRAESLLKSAIALAKTTGLQAAGSGEFVTNYTLNAEKVTQFYTGIPIDTSITASELTLGNLPRGPVSASTVDQVTGLNSSAMALTKAIADFKERLLQDVLNCRTFVHSYPTLLDHVHEEAQFYLRSLQKIQNRTPLRLTREAVEQENFWNHIMGEHAKFIRGLLDPAEEQLFDKANYFGKEFDRLTAEAKALYENMSKLPQVTQRSLRATTSLRDFKRSGVEGILDCKIKIVSLPLLADHVLREANHYLRMLNIFSRAR